MMMKIILWGAVVLLGIAWIVRRSGNKKAR
jgi:hypothetical protein